MQQGATIEHFNPPQQPAAFEDNTTAKAFLERSGTEALPLILVNGEVALAGRYPNRDELARWANITSGDDEESSCCGGCCEGEFKHVGWAQSILRAIYIINEQTRPFPDPFPFLPIFKNQVHHRILSIVNLLDNKGGTWQHTIHI